MERINLSWDEVYSRAHVIAEGISKDFPGGQDVLHLYGIPRGGIYAAQLISTALNKINIPNVLLENPDQVDIFIDDIVDTGTTANKWIRKTRGGVVFYALVEKLGKDTHLKDKWFSFPWERMTGETGPMENIRRLLQYIGEDPERDGLKETPQRVIKSYEKLFGGYKQKPSDVIKIFEVDCDEMILVKDITFHSTCEHHMLPFYGKAHIAYIPNKKVIGISKLIRILEIYSRRLQMQERLCTQVTTAIDELIKPIGTACVLEAQHLCIICRGVEKQNSIMVTSSLIGSFKTSVSARAEFMNMIKG